MMSIFKACFEKHIHLPRFSTHSFIMGCFDDISTIEIQCLVYGIRVRDIRHTTNPKHRVLCHPRFPVHVNGYLCKTPHSSVEFKKTVKTVLFTKIFSLPPYVATLCYLLLPSPIYFYLPLTTAAVARVATATASAVVSIVAIESCGRILKSCSGLCLRWHQSRYSSSAILLSSRIACNPI